jgi:hypothetical protein
MRTAQTWNYAHAESLESTSRACERFFLRNFAHCTRTAAFLTLERSLLKSALSKVCPQRDEG